MLAPAAGPPGERARHRRSGRCCRRARRGSRPRHSRRVNLCPGSANTLELLPDEGATSMPLGEHEGGTGTPFPDDHVEAGCGGIFHSHRPWLLRVRAGGAGPLPSAPVVGGEARRVPERSGRQRSGASCRRHRQGSPMRILPAWSSTRWKLVDELPLDGVALTPIRASVPIWAAIPGRTRVADKPVPCSSRESTR
jgi:hypothetical protein